MWPAVLCIIIYTDCVCVCGHERERTEWQLIVMHAPAW